MTEVLQSSSSHFPSSPSSIIVQESDQEGAIINVQEGGGEGTKEREEGKELPLITILVTALRKSLISCSISGTEKALCAMEIGLPTNVKHVAHVTFDRFHGFLGLPVEFELEVPKRPPSASANVFGVSTESMQLSFDSRGNSVPTILLLMQRHLYAQGGLQAEGIFRITTDNSHEEYVREQLNRGVIPNYIDVHCLAGLIKAWFRELPSGVLDSLPPELVIKSQSEEECGQLVRLLPPTEAALLDWSINLMADVVQLEHLNKMNARNVAMVFAPNMTQMTDPLTALMHAVQVMNFLKTLIIRTLKERELTMVDSNSDKDRQQSSSHLHKDVNNEAKNKGEGEKEFVAQESTIESPYHSAEEESTNESNSQNLCADNQSLVDTCPGVAVSQVKTSANDHREGSIRSKSRKSRISQSKKANERSTDCESGPEEKSKRTRIINRMNSRMELSDACR